MAGTDKWRTSEDGAGHAPGVIGPNAILQLLPVLDQHGGSERRKQMLAEAGIVAVPDGTSMIPEGDAARLHHQLRTAEPEDAPVLAAQAGVGTANYILAHRIPKPAQWLLRALPGSIAAPILSKAIAQHAWTFVGSGQFKVVDPWTFEIRDNPLIRGENSANCLCDWHAGVFTQLYRTLVTSRCTCREVSCCAQGAGRPCRFEIRRQV